LQVVGPAYYATLIQDISWTFPAVRAICIIGN
jgi:hypothetical protein